MTGHNGEGPRRVATADLGAPANADLLAAALLLHRKPG